MPQAPCKPSLLLIGTLLIASLLPAQQSPGTLNSSGNRMRDGRSQPYRIHRLPINAFPDLPESVAAALAARNCLIPQSYGARHPENAVRASLERPGSSDWAVLCSAKGSVALLVFFADAPATEPVTLATFPEEDRLQVHDLTGVLGFDWAIDPATPRQVRDAQAGMAHRPPPLDHDALADTVLDHPSQYHYFENGAWTVLDTGL